MPYVRTLRRGQSLRISGPATITLLTPSRAKLSIDAPPDVRIDAGGHAGADVIPLRRAPRAGLDSAA